MFLLTVQGPQVLDDILLDDGHGNSGEPTSDSFAVGANEKLLKIPLDVREFERLPEEPIGSSKTVSHWGAGILQIGELLLLIFTVHVPFLKQLEVWHKPIAGTDVPQQGKDLIVFSWFLFTKLVGWKCKDCEAE